VIASEAGGARSRVREPRALPGARDPRMLLEAVVVFAGVLLVYLSTLAEAHGEAEDSMRYAMEVRSGDPELLFIPYHLAYGWVGRGFYLLWTAFGWDRGSLVPLQVLNALIGAFGVGVLWCVLRGVVAGRLAAVAGCGLLAFSAGYWWYSVEVEVYVLSAVVLIGAITFALRAATAPSETAFLRLGLISGLAVLGHNTNVLFGGVGLAALVIAAPRLTRGRVVRCGLWYAAGTVLVVGPAYAVALAVVDATTPSEAYDWMTGYVFGPEWGTWSATSVVKAVTGLGRGLIGGHFAFSLDPVRDAVLPLVPRETMRERLFLVRNFTPGLALALVPLVLATGAGVVVLVVRWLRRPVLTEQTRVLAILCLVWFVTYAAFFTWWEPFNVEFWIAPWVALAILFAICNAERPDRPLRWRGLAIGVVVVSLFTCNLVGTVWPQLDRENDYWRVRLAWFEENAVDSDLIVAQQPTVAYYLRYFAPSRVIDAELEVFLPVSPDHERAVVELDARLNREAADRVLTSDEFFHPAADEYSCCPDADLAAQGLAARSRFFGRSRILATPELEVVYEIERTSGSRSPDPRATRR